MLFAILLTAQIIVCLAMGALVLMQRSEGGALGMGGGPSGFMSARGAGNLLTKATSVLGFLFFSLAIAMSVVGNLDSRRGSAIENLDTSGLTAAPVTPSQAPAAAASSTSSAPSLADLPLAGATPSVASSSSAAPIVMTPRPAASSSAAPASAPAASTPPVSTTSPAQ